MTSAPLICRVVEAPGCCVTEEPGCCIGGTPYGRGIVLPDCCIGGTAYGGGVAFNCSDPESGAPPTSGTVGGAWILPFSDANGLKPEPAAGGEVKGCALALSVGTADDGCTIELPGGTGVNGRRFDLPSAGRMSEASAGVGETMRGPDPTGSKKGKGRKPDPSDAVEVGRTCSSTASVASRGGKGRKPDPSEGRRKLSL